MKEQQFNQLTEFLKTNHEDLYRRFHANIVGDINGVAVIRPMDVSDEDFNRITQVIDEWEKEYLPGEDYNKLVKVI
jgi:phage FluMu protein gp41